MHFIEYLLSTWTLEPGHLGEIHLGCIHNSCLTVLLICCYVTNDPHTLWFKLIIYFTHESVSQEFWRQSKKWSSVYMTSVASGDDLNSWELQPWQLGAHWASVLLYMALPLGSLPPPFSMIASRSSDFSMCLRTPRVSVPRDRRWNLPNKALKPGPNGKVLLLPYHISESRHRAYEFQKEGTPLTGRVLKNLWTSLVCQNGAGPLISLHLCFFSC